MRQNLDKDVLNRVSYLVGTADLVEAMVNVPARLPFDEPVVEFLNDVSRHLMKMPEAKAYPDVMTLGFWIRKSSVLQMKEKYGFRDSLFHMGRGIAFHIAPSNVPVNYAYSLVAGLLTGNANIVRVPSREFPQVGIINRAITESLDRYENMKPYICLVRYARDNAINDVLSSVADTRIIWGGDATIGELRRSPLPPRSTEITFADRFSIAVLDSNSYMAHTDKRKVAEDFYNDTYLTDQNACTSPRLVVWTGSEIENAKREFWGRLHDLVQKKYTFQDIQGVNKLTSSYIFAAQSDDVRLVPRQDNLIVRIKLSGLADDLMDYRDNSGYFFEYDCKDILELKSLCDDKRCQTIGVLGDRQMIRPLLAAGVKGIDRIVDIGKTMDFDLVWDGYHLVERLTRAVAL